MQKTPIFCNSLDDVIIPSVEGPARRPRSALVELKQRNEWAVIEALRTRPLTRPELTSVTGLSRSTVANVVVDLQRRGLVDAQARPQPLRIGPGRHGAVVSLRSAAGVAIGIAIDREWLRVAAVDLTARVLAEHAEPITPAATGPAIITRCAESVRSIAADIAIPVGKIVGVGIGIPGPVDIAYGGVHPTATLKRWAGFDVRTELSRQLDGLHVFPDNDANYGALGEHQYGAGRDAQNLIYIRIGPGIGGGLIIDDQLHRGDRGFAGEIGHITAVETGNPCPCGRRGCLSTVASSAAIGKRLAPTHGPQPTASDILDLAAASDQRTIAALHDAGAHVGRVLSNLVNALNPAIVILGGELGAGSHHLLKATSRTLAKHIQPIAGHDLRIEHAQLAHRSEVLGASARVLRDTQHVRTYVSAA